jgi:serine/threonine protein kinase
MTTGEFERYCPSCFERMPGASVCADRRCGEGASWHSGDSLPIGTELDGRYIVGRRDERHYSEAQYLAWDQFAGRKVVVRECRAPRLVHRSDDGVTLRAHEPESARVFATGCRIFVRDGLAFSLLREDLGIVAVRAVFEQNDTAYVVTDFADEPTLESILTETPDRRLAYSQTVRLLLPAVHALSAMHESGTLHYRVRPDEIVVGRTGKGRLRFVGEARMWLACRNIGTDDPPEHGPYAPLEESGSRTYEPCSDIYSIAATFYRAITGRVPPEAIDRLVSSDELVPPSRLGLRLPRGIEPALMHALALNTGERMQTLADLVAAFNDAPAVIDEDTLFEMPPVMRPAPDDGGEDQP